MMQKLEYPSVGETLYQDTLPNGLRISVLTKPGYTRCFAMFAADYGGADRRFRLNGEETDTPAGIAHFLEHKMFDMPDGTDALSLLAANGAQPNAYTSSGITAYHFESTDHFFENLRILLRFVSTPWFTDASVAKEQGIIGQEIRMYEDSPDHVIYKELLRCLYDHHPVREDVVGTVDSIAEITPDTLYRCHGIFYRPCNMALAVAGDVDPEAVRAAALEILPADGGERPLHEYGAPESAFPVRQRFLRAMEVSAPQFMIGAKVPVPSSGAGLQRTLIVCSIALRYLYGPSSPFYSRLYADGLLNTDFFADLDHVAGTMTVVAGGESRDPEAVFGLFAAEAEQAAEQGLDGARFRRVRKARYGSSVRALTSFAGMCASLVKGTFCGFNCLDDFAVSESVTEAEVRDFIREYLARDRFAMSVIVPAGKEDTDHA